MDGWQLLAWVTVAALAVFRVALLVAVVVVVVVVVRQLRAIMVMPHPR